MVNKILKGCTNFGQFIYEGSHSIYELLLKVLEKQDEIIDEVNGLEETVNSNYNDLNTRKEDSINITTSRKLSPTGNFTGTWFSDTKINIDSLILNGQILYQSVVDLINTSPELNIEILDGGFFMGTDLIEEIELGNFTDSITSEIDCGLFIYPCQCTL